MKTLLVKRTTTQYVSRVVGDTILWTHDPALALVMSCAKATALAAKLQWSADHNGEQYQPPGEYGVKQL